MAYRIDLSETAKDQLARIAKGEAKRIAAFLGRRLASLDRPRDIGKASKGPLGGLWSYRVGDYRLVCDIQDEVVSVLVVTIAHRRDVYR